MHQGCGGFILAPIVTYHGCMHYGLQTDCDGGQIMRGDLGKIISLRGQERLEFGLARSTRVALQSSFCMNFLLLAWLVIALSFAVVRGWRS
jgi:hypothetical protein